MARDSELLEPGTTIGRFTLGHLLGLGETSSVYAARDAATGRSFALKLYSAPFEMVDADRALVEEFSSTAPNAIVRMLEIGQHGSHPFVVMELVEGVPLSSFVERQATVAPSEKLRWLQSLCAAVAHLHERGVVHGRLTPARIVLTSGGQLKLLGIPLPAVAKSERARWPDFDVGYQSPERIRSGADSRGADVFAIGAIGYELLTYVAPFGADTSDAIAARVLSENPTPLLQISHDVPRVLAEVIDKALAKDPGVRFPDAVSLNAVLSSIRPAPLPTQARSTLSVASIRHPPEDVQFTVYRPRAVRPEEWRRLLAFMHLADRRPDAPAEEPSPLERVEEVARQALGTEARQFGHTTADGRLAVPREGEITLVPSVDGVEFNPERRTFRWVEDVHQETFLLRARPEAEGTTVRGRMAAYLGVILLAEVDISMRVDAALGADPASSRPEPSSANAYRRIFASYSRRDREIVRQFELFVEALGDRYLVDVRNLPTGADWRAGLRTLIHDADVFQLFWSRNSMRSEHVREEWEYALSLNRPAFIRPTYWEEPMPESPSESLPPEALRRLHFHRLCWSVPAVAPPLPRSSRNESTGSRKSQMGVTLEAGQRALAAGDVGAALDLAQNVLLLDPGNHEAVALLRAVEESFAKQQRSSMLSDHALDARRSLEAGDLERAEQIVSELAAVAPNAKDVAELRDRVRSVRREREQERLRDARARAFVEYAERALERGALDVAEDVSHEGLSQMPESDAARQLASVLERVHEERRVLAEKARQIETERREQERRHVEARQAEARRAEEWLRAQEQKEAAEKQEATRLERAKAAHQEELLRERERQLLREKQEQRSAERGVERQKHDSTLSTVSGAHVAETTPIEPSQSATPPTLRTPASHMPSAPGPKAMRKRAGRYLAVAFIVAALLLGLWLLRF